MAQFKSGGKGFTLAEVLVTLVVVGVITALVIPGILQTTDNTEYKTALKRVYSDLSQATNRIIVDNNGSLKGVFYSNDWSVNPMKIKYQQYFTYSKSCIWYSSPFYGVCWHANNSWYDMSGSPLSDTLYDGIVLNNGALVLFHITDSVNCAFGCGWIRVDVNGFKGPNRVGKDIFMFNVLENGLKPYGAQDGRICSGTGWGCATTYLMQ